MTMGTFWSNKDIEIVDGSSDDNERQNEKDDLGNISNQDASNIKRP